MSLSGALFGDLALNKALAGSTAVRNPRIAKVFEEMELYESWGNGLRRIQESCSKLGLPEPLFQEIGDMFRVNLFRPQYSSQVDMNVDMNVDMKPKNGELSYNPSAAKTAILEVIADNPSVSVKTISEMLLLSQTTVWNHINAMKADGLITRVGSTRGGQWLIAD